MTWSAPHVTWLMVGLLLFVLSFWSSISSGWLTHRKNKALEAELAQKQDDLRESANRNLEYRAKLGELSDELARTIDKVRGFEAKAAEDAAKLSPESPRLYPSLKEPGSVTGREMETRLVLTNEGGSHAHGITIASLDLRSGAVSFEAISVIAPNGNGESVPNLGNGVGALFKRNIIHALEAEWETYPDYIDGKLKQTISIPLVITYSDYRGLRYETACDLVFNGIVEALKGPFKHHTPSVEFCNFRFQRA